MLQRVMVAVLGVPFLLVVLGWAPDWATMVLMAAMCAVGAYEFLHAVAVEKGKRLVPLTMLAAGLVPVCIYLEESTRNLELTALPVLPFTAAMALVFVFALFVYAILHYGREGAIPFADVTGAIFGGLDLNTPSLSVIYSNKY